MLELEAPCLSCLLLALVLIPLQSLVVMMPLLFLVLLLVMLILLLASSVITLNLLAILLRSCIMSYFWVNVVYSILLIAGKNQRTCFQVLCN